MNWIRSSLIRFTKKSQINFSDSISFFQTFFCTTKSTFPDTVPVDLLHSLGLLLLFLRKIFLLFSFFLGKLVGRKFLRWVWASIYCNFKCIILGYAYLSGNPEGGWTVNSNNTDMIEANFENKGNMSDFDFKFDISSVNGENFIQGEFF